VSEPPAGRQLPLFPRVGAPPLAAPRAAPLAPPTPATSLAAAAGAFAEHLGRMGKTENTRRAFASDLRLLGRRVGPDRPVAEITTADLRGFLSWLLAYRDRPCSPKSYARRVTTLKVFFAWLQESGAVRSDPALALVHRRADPPLPQPLAPDEVQALLAEAARRRLHGGDARPELVVRLLLDTGLKKGELVRLRAADLDLEARPPTLLVRYDSPRWRQKERRLAFDPGLLAVLEAYRARFGDAERLFDCTARNLEYVLADLVAASGLPEGTSFETLRWTSAARAHAAGVDDEALRERLGLSPVTWADTRRKLELLAR